MHFYWEQSHDISGISTVKSLCFFIPNVHLSQKWAFFIRIRISNNKFVPDVKSLNLCSILVYSNSFTLFPQFKKKHLHWDGFQKCKSVQKSRIKQIRPKSWRQLAGVSSDKTGKPGLDFSFRFCRLVLSDMAII